MTTSTKSLVVSMSSMQLILFDSFAENITIEKVIKNRKTQKRELKTYKKLYSPFKDHYEYINPICPVCGSTKNNKQGFRKRKIRSEESKKPEIVYLKRYKCKNCNSNFQTMLKNVVGYKKRYAKVFMGKIREQYKNGYRSLRKIAKDIENFLKQKISHTTIAQFLKIVDDDTIINTGINFTGFYAYDEQHIKINGHKKFRLTLIDTILKIPVAEKIINKMEKEAIKSFLKEVTTN